MDKKYAEDAFTESLNSVESSKQDAADETNDVSEGALTDSAASSKGNKEQEIPTSNLAVDDTEDKSNSPDQTEEPLSLNQSVDIEKNSTESAAIQDVETSPPNPDDKENDVEKELTDQGELAVELIQTEQEIDVLHDKNKVPEEHEDSVKRDTGKDEWDGVDFSSYSKEALVETIKKLAKHEDAIRADVVLMQIKTHFDKIQAAERSVLLEKYVEDGGDKDSFYFKPDELFTRFGANFRLIKDRKSSLLKSRGIEKQKNLELAEAVLVKLRNYVDSEESSVSFEKIKLIQQEWKEIGDVPAQRSRSLWANYKALLYRFYDQRSIYFELKELDRKKNYDLKVVLCERAKELVNVKSVKEAIAQLNDLHHEYKHIGPVPRVLQQDLWHRFKIASDAIYTRRKEFVAELKTELFENLTAKRALAEEALQYAQFEATKISEWNQTTKKVLDLQKKWDAIGGLPKDKAKEVNRLFWSNFKKYFSNKNVFFKKLDSERKLNLVKVEKLIEQAESLKENNDWDKTAEKLKKLQQEWQSVGPVPDRKRKAVYDRFKSACDYFFQHKRSESKQVEVGYQENLSKKEEIIKQLNEFIENPDDNIEAFNKARSVFESIGYIPKRDISKINSDYKNAIEEFVRASHTMKEHEKESVLVEIQLGDILKGNNSDSALYQKEQSIRRQINKLEDDIALWQNNLEFFAASKSADKLKIEVNKKVDSATDKLNQLKRQLKAIRSM